MNKTPLLKFMETRPLDAWAIFSFVYFTLGFLVGKFL